MLTVLKGLPLAYNRDLQEDKEPLFDALDTTLGCLEVMAGTVATMSFLPERAFEMTDSGFITATDLADVLVERGMDFPNAHRLAGEIVLHCEREGRKITDLTDEELGDFSGLLAAGGAAGVTVQGFNFEASGSGRNVAGSGRTPDRGGRQEGNGARAGAVISFAGKTRPRVVPAVEPLRRPG